jgi:hypothetical protein
LYDLWYNIVFGLILKWVILSKKLIISLYDEIQKISLPVPARENIWHTIMCRENIVHISLKWKKNVLLIFWVLLNTRSGNYCYVEFTKESDDDENNSLVSENVNAWSMLGGKCKFTKFLLSDVYELSQFGLLLNIRCYKRGSGEWKHRDFIFWCCGLNGNILKKFSI